MRRRVRNSAHWPAVDDRAIACSAAAKLKLINTRRRWSQTDKPNEMLSAEDSARKKTISPRWLPIAARSFGTEGTVISRFTPTAVQKTALESLHHKKTDTSFRLLLAQMTSNFRLLIPGLCLRLCVRLNKLINSSNYNLYIHCCCWCFGNRCCLCHPVSDVWRVGVQKHIQLERCCLPSLAAFFVYLPLLCSVGK